MNMSGNNTLPALRRVTALVLSAFAFVLAGVQPAQAVQSGGGTVSYDPILTALTGDMPYTSSFLVRVKAPSNFPIGGSAVIGFTITPTTWPSSMSLATAQSLLTITPVSSGTFTAANQELTYTVTASFPVVTPSSGSSVSYSYDITTNNWPASIAGFLTDGGFSVGATATVPSGGGSTQPPTVSITSPTNGTVLNYPFGTVFPLQVPLNFVGGAPAGSVVDSLSANLGGSSLTVTNSSLPAASVTATASMTITGPGTYTAGVGSYNNIGSATAVTTFAVVVAPAFTPPEVIISTPADGSTITVGAGSLPITVPIQFTSTSSTPTASAITAVTASVDGTSVAVTSTGLNTVSVSSSGNVVISTPGAHTVTATATNQGGIGSDLNTFTVVVQAAPPTVVINSPTVNSVYNYRIGTAATVVPFTFTATSSFGGIQTLTAKVDSANVVFTPVGLGTNTATGSIDLPYTTAGTHTVSVTTTDNNGTASAVSNFTVNVIAPTPTIVINQPTAGATFAMPVGATSTSVPYSFVTTSNNGFFVDSVSASLDGTPITIGGTTGLGTASATSTGTLVGVTAGTHILVATGISSGITVSTSTTFTVTATQPPPSVVINTPAAGSTFSRVSGGPALSIPLTFTGTSNATNGVITQLKASLNGTALTVTPTGIGQRVANGAATMSVTNAGTYTISVTAIDAYGTASATRTFSVTVVQPRTICGSVFFDVDADGNYDCEDYDISGITVKLYNSADVLVGTDVTDCGGDYSFCSIAPGTYKVVATAYAGLKVTTVSERTVTVAGCDVCVPKFGVGLDFVAIRTMAANGYTIGYWKNNLDKAISGSCNGIQVSKTTLTSYTCKISSFALSPFDNITMKIASSTMAYNGSTPSSLLSKQLIASEYNYQNAAYLNGNKNLTMAFLWWGEYVRANPSRYSSTYIIWAKDWFDAYNNSHGGVVAGPN